MIDLPFTLNRTLQKIFDDIRERHGSDGAALAEFEVLYPTLEVRPARPQVELQWLVRDGELCFQAKGHKRIYYAADYHEVKLEESKAITGIPAPFVNPATKALMIALERQTAALDRAAQATPPPPPSVETKPAITTQLQLKPRTQQDILADDRAFADEVKKRQRVNNNCKETRALEIMAAELDMPVGTLKRRFYRGQKRLEKAKRRAREAERKARNIKSKLAT